MRATHSPALVTATARATLPLARRISHAELQRMCRCFDSSEHASVLVKYLDPNGCRGYSAGARICGVLFPPKQSEAIVGGSYYRAPATLTPSYRVQQNVKIFFGSGPCG